MQVGAADRLDTVHRAQVARVALHQRRRQPALLQQFLRPIDVGHDPLQQAHALQQAGFDLLPVFGFDQQREQVERPGPLRSALVGVDVVGDAVVADLARQIDGALVQFGRALVGQVVEELLPGFGQRAVGAGGAAQFIEMPGCGAAR